MKTRDEIEKTLREHKEELSSRFHVGKIGIFGSYVRQESTERSDLDVLVEFTKPVGFFEFMDLEEYIEGLVGIKIDLVSVKGLKPYIGKQILNEVIYV
ncbi:MAG TPA: nucleotidyltransferase family protein [Spirochaetota bacterium]|jgi:predicted nucleotidyltransferase|nr:nucleotidyltransferase family protein [Spirochaetota bacterium]HPV41603.1 nucleotidyltransferase family protein [Spirochaetota bacterium]